MANSRRMRLIGFIISLALLCGAAADGTLQHELHSILGGVGAGLAVNPIKWQIKISNLVTKAVKTGTVMSPTEVALLEDVIDMFINSTIPAIRGSHEEDVLEVTKFLEESKTCGRDLTSLETHDIAYLDTVCEEWENQATACLETQTDRETLNETVCATNYFGWITEVRASKGPDCRDMDGAPSDDVADYFSLNKIWFNDLEAHYLRKERLCHEANQSLWDQIPICDNLEKSQRDSWCKYCHMAHYAATRYETCYNRSATNYRTSIEATKAAIADRKVEYEAIKKATCYLTILIEKNFNAAALETCQTLEVDFSFLTIIFAAEPAKKVLIFAECADESLNGCPWYEAMLPENVVDTGEDKGMVDDCRRILINGRCHLESTNLGSCQGFKTGKDCCPKTCLSAPEVVKWGDMQCTSGSIPLTQAECESSLELRGRPSFGGASQYSDRPYGCFVWALGVNHGDFDQEAYFNPNHSCDGLQTVKECVENDPNGNNSQETQWLLDHRFKLVCKPTPTCADSHTCPSGYVALAGQSASTNVTDASCCQATCAAHTCLSGYVALAGQSASTPATTANCCQDINECDLAPCKNGGMCSESTTDVNVAIGAYQCTCANGFSGTDCDECAAGKGYVPGVGNGVATCVACARGAWNNENTHNSSCADQQCPDGHGVVSDQAGWTATGGNCEKCGAGYISPAGSGQCVATCAAHTCPSGYIALDERSASTPATTANCCQAVACPLNSGGTSVPSGCTCNVGFSGDISATSTSPFYSGSCEVAAPAVTKETDQYLFYDGPQSECPAGWKRITYPGDCRAAFVALADATIAAVNADGTGGPHDDTKTVTAIYGTSGSWGGYDPVVPPTKACHCRVQQVGIYNGLISPMLYGWQAAQANLCKLDEACSGGVAEYRGGEPQKSFACMCKKDG